MKATLGRINQKRLPELHKSIIEDALSEGKPVPAEVLADYPDLAQTAKLKAGAVQAEQLPPTVAPVPPASAPSLQAERPTLTMGEQSWRNTLIPKMLADGIKDFSDAELERVFGGSVSARRSIENARRLIDKGAITAADVRIALPPSPPAAAARLPYESPAMTWEGTPPVRRELYTPPPAPVVEPVKPTTPAPYTSAWSKENIIRSMGPRPTAEVPDHRAGLRGCEV